MILYIYDVYSSYSQELHVCHNIAQTWKAVQAEATRRDYFGGNSCSAVDQILLRDGKQLASLVCQRVPSLRNFGIGADSACTLPLPSSSCQSPARNSRESDTGAIEEPFIDIDRVSRRILAIESEVSASS